MKSATPVRRRVRTPTILQMEAVECGAASLAMILAYHRRFIPLEELRQGCGVSRDGSKASNILRAARAYGFDAKGFKKEPAELRTLPLPMIVHWNFNHFLVLEGFHKGKAYLNDPGHGATIVTEAEFDQAFTGVALVFEPTADFKPGGEGPGIVRPLLRRLSGARGGLAFVVLAGLGLLIPGLASPTFSKTFVDAVLVKGLAEWAPALLALMAATAFTILGLTVLQQRYLLRLESKLSLQNSGRFFWHVLRLPVEFFSQRFAGEIGNRVSINDDVARLLSGDLATTMLNLTVVAMYAVLLVQYDAVLATVAVGTALLNVTALRFASRRRGDLNQRLIQDRGKLMGTAMGGLQTIETLKASGSESDFFSRWAGYQAKVANSQQQQQLVALTLSAVPPLLMALNTAVVLGLGGLRVMDGRLTMGMLVAFQALAFAFLAPVNRLVDLGGTLQEIRGDMARLDDVLQAKPDPTAPAASPIVPTSGDAGDDMSIPVKLAGHLQLRGLTFGYNLLDPPLIEHFDLTLRPGSRVALVGGSGSGKSTVAKLLAGLYTPWSGDILFDGIPRTEVPRTTLTASFAVVDQDVCLFEDTMRANLTLWDDTVPESDLVQAARDACIHDDITARPGGYTSTLEEGGRNFSGGQRQRMEIARALVGNPSIMVLDEATSALDPATEQIIDDNLRRRGCTCLIVAHRLSTVRDCDEIIVMERGKIVQRGTHAELSTTTGHYRDLVAAE